MESPILANTTLPDPPVIVKGHADSVLSLAFSPDRQLLASGSRDDSVRLWNAVSGAHIATLTGHSSSVVSVAFSPDSTMIISGSWDQSVRLWDVGSRTQIAVLNGHSRNVRTVAFSPNNAYLASGSDDNTILLWDAKTRASISTLQGHSDWVKSVGFSPDSRRIASGSDDSTVRLWDVASGTSIATLRSHSGLVVSVTFSSSGEYLASGSTNGNIRLWNAVTGDEIAVLEGHSKGVMSVAFSPDNKHLVSGSHDNTVQLWDITSRSRITTFQGHSDRVWSVAFSPDGFHFASASSDKTIRLWSIAPQHSGISEDPIAEPPMVESTQATTMSHNEYEIASPSASIALSNDITSYISLAHSDRIGLGGFGDLYLGNHTDRGKVALKRPHRLFDEASIRRFLREVDLWCSISHPHVLSCLGMCRIGPDVYVVSPFIENGDLLSCMNRGQVLNRSKLLYEIAEALAHLHHKGIVHGDVKAQNILLSDDGSALLCDFGLAKAFDSMVTSTESKGAGSVRWMAPELFKNGSRSMASDVYSLGITISEVLSGQPPFPTIPDNIAVMFHVVYENGRPPKVPLSSPEGRSYSVLWETAEKCWATQVGDRPYMAQVLGMLFPLTREGK